MIPSVKFKKVRAATGVTRASAVGICAIISVASAGPMNTPSAYTDGNTAYNDFQDGPLAEIANYEIGISGKPAILIRANPSTPGAYGAVVFTGTGTSVATGDGASKPFDDYSVLVTTVAGGTIGVAGIVYTYSLDGGKTTSAQQSLGTGNNITIPNSGVKIDLAAGTLVAGDTIAIPCTGPLITTTDLATALEALRVCALPWEWLLVDRIAASSTITSQLDTWLAALENVGKFRGASVNARFMNAGETEAAYETAMATMMASVSSIRMIAGADAGDLTSDLTGWTLPRPASLFATTRMMASAIGTDPAYVNDGPLDGCVILGSNGVPVHHDEQAHPGLDDIRLTALRSINGEIGAFVNNANVISTPGSDYVYAQHVRTMNRACETAFQILTKSLSRGVPKNPKADPLTGKVTIQEGAAREIEDVVNSAVRAELGTQVTASKFTLSRQDDLSSNLGVTITATQEIESLAYVKGFLVTSTFSRSITFNP